MKKATCFIIILSLVFSLCACTQNEDSGKTVDSSVSADNPDKTGEGFNTVMATLFISNLYFAEDVFIYGHLPVSDSETVKEGFKNYAPVNSDAIKSFSDLSEAVNAVFCEEAAEKLLNKAGYKDIDGKLYFNTNSDPKSRNFTYDTSDMTVQIEDKNDSSCSFTVSLKKVKDSKEKDFEIDCNAVCQEGNWKLEKIYY